MNYLILFGSCFAVSLGYLKFQKKLDKDGLIKSLVISGSLTIIMLVIRGVCDLFLNIIEHILF